MITEEEISNLLNQKKFKRFRSIDESSIELRIGEFQVIIKSEKNKLSLDINDPYFIRYQPIKVTEDKDYFQRSIYLIKGEPIQYKNKVYFIKDIKGSYAYCTEHPLNDDCVEININNLKPISKDLEFAKNNQDVLECFYIISPLLKKNDSSITAKIQAENNSLNKKSVDRYLYKYRDSFNIYDINKLAESHNKFQRFHEKPFFNDHLIKSNVDSIIINIYKKEIKFPLRESHTLVNEYLLNIGHKIMSKSTLCRHIDNLKIIK